MIEIPATVKTRVATGGRVVIPAAFRKALGIETGDQVILRLEEGAVTVISPAEALRRLQDLVSRVVPEGVSLAQELIRERREEAQRE